MTPLKAIREKCIDCCGSANEVPFCPCTDCTLYPFRLGKNPNIKGGTFNLTADQKKANAERLREYVEKRRENAD